MAYPDDPMDELDPNQRALLMPQPVQRSPTFTLPGEGTPVAPPSRAPAGMPGTRPGEVQSAQLSGSGPPPAYVGGGGGGGGGTSGQFQVKGHGSGSGTMGTVYKLAPGMVPYQVYTYPDGTKVIPKPSPNMKGAFDLELVTKQPGPGQPGKPYQEGELTMMPDKEGIPQAVGIAPSGTPDTIFEFKGQVYRRDKDGKGVSRYDPESERVPVDDLPGMPKGATLPRKQRDELVAKQYEAQQQAARDQAKREWEEGEKRRAADYAAKIAERKAGRDADREELKTRDAEMVPFNAVRGQLDQMDSLLASGARTGSPLSLGLPLAKAAQALGVAPQDANKQIDMLTVFEAATKRLANLQHVPGTGNPSNRDAQWILESGPQLANSPRANTALSGRMRQYMDWAENVQKAKKAYLSGGDDRRLQDFSVDGTDLERIFPQWGQDTFDKRYGKLRDGMVYLDRFGGYQDFNPKAKVMSKLSKEEYDKLPPGTVVIDDDGIPLTK